MSRSLLSPVAFRTKAGGDERSAKAGGDAADPFGRMVLPTDPESNPEKDQYEELFPNTPEEKLQSARRSAETQLSRGKRLGLDMAVELLERYLAGSGETKFLTRSEARELEPIRQAEQANRNHFEAAFVDRASDAGRNKRLHLALIGLQDGERVELTDVKVQENLPSLGKNLGGLIRHPDFTLAIGGTIFRATGNFAAERRGDAIHITGTVKHWWRERYDFENSKGEKTGFFSSQAEMLEAHGGAAPFNVRSEWRQRVSGTIRIANGELGEVKLRWVDETWPGQE